jgi:general secretion pathway protein K
MIRTRNAKTEGYALVAVLVVVSFLAILALTLGAQFRSNAKVSAMHLQRIQEKALFETALALAIVGLTNPDPAEAWVADGTEKTLTIRGKTIKVRIDDEHGKLDINAADPKHLGEYLSAFVENEAVVARLVDSIQDWRDSDTESRPSGAETATYRREKRRVYPRNKNFERVSELLWVRGMTRELFTCIVPGLTVHSHRRSVDSSIAQDLVKKALKLDTKEEAKEAVSAMRGGLGGRAFAINVAFRSKFGGANYHSIIRITEGKTNPYWVLENGRFQDVGDSGSCLKSGSSSDAAK